ncbi:hypothetical protein NQ318_007664 [Aromia moschata]|uniref:OAR domain-containing protein n=1 Tax=Aromia moschata TaxID=1265417 RepID=A0AAV8XK64_9CUCU|nr:hypothetical protein NQ318_007664 [Aromia moschata]
MNKDNGPIPTSQLFALINKDSYGSVNRGNKFGINSDKCVGFPGLCSCCPIKPITNLGSSLLPSSDASQISPGGSDQRSSSVAELRRKAQEHSAALLQSLQHVANFQQAATLGGLNFPLLPPLTTLQALQRKHESTEAAAAAAAAGVAKESNSV